VRVIGSDASHAASMNAQDLSSRPVRARAFIARAIRAASLLARDERIPKPLRWLVLFGLLPIPGPVDEVVLLVAAPLLFVFGRVPMREAWRSAGPR
jgi:hypothetical protein